MNIQDGTYAARPGQARVYENDKGSLVLCIEVQIEGGPVLKSYHTLARADGTLMTRTIDNLKSWSGWDGTDPFWFLDNDLSGIAVEVVIENQPGITDPNRLFPSVKWVNPVGGGSGGLAESDDRRSILAKYGGKLRANAGGTPVGAPTVGRSGSGAIVPAVGRSGGQPFDMAQGKAGGPVGGRAVPCPAPVRPAAGAAVPPNPVARVAPSVSDMNTCWGLMCDLCKKMPKPQVEREWFASVGIIEGKDQADMTPEEWGRVAEFIAAKYGSGAVPRPAAGGAVGAGQPAVPDADPMPF